MTTLSNQGGVVKRVSRIRLRADLFSSALPANSDLFSRQIYFWYRHRQSSAVF